MGAYTELVDFTFTANETSRTFSGLSITKDDFIKVAITHINPLTNQVALRFFPNANTTNTNYHRQGIFSGGTVVTANRTNANVFSFTAASSTSTILMYVKISENNRFNFFANSTRDNTSGVNLIFDYITQSSGADTTSITSLTLTADTTNGIATGSRIQIYRLDAEKVADITVTSNTTQVDISNLSIDKDSEYLLVSDVTFGTGSNYYLTPNDLTTLTNYHNQAIVGNGSTASAIRQNNPFYLSNVENPSLAYTHIKLSNIGAFTFQSYNIRGTGNSSLRLSNFFGSSTSESITNITKLNIFSDTANAIGTGSRFTLYKLYE